MQLATCNLQNVACNLQLASCMLQVANCEFECKAFWHRSRLVVWACLVLIKALPDYTGVKPAKAKADGTPGPTYQSKLATFLSTRGPAEGTANPPLLAQRDANVFHMVAADHSLHGGLGLSLLNFKAKNPLMPLVQGDKRYLVPIETLSRRMQQACSGRKFRSCIQASDGTRRYEVNWGDSSRCVLSSAVDMGPIGWPNKVFLYTKGGVRGYPWPDPAHRRTDNTALSVTASSLSSARAERVIVNNVLNGPFDGSANFRLVLAAAKEYFSNADAHDELYRAFYPRICEDLFGECGPELGTEAHYAEVWERLPMLGIFRARGRTMKIGRWFQFEEKTVAMLPYDSVLALVLTYFAIVKGWHTSFFETKAGGGGIKLDEAPTLAAHVPADARPKVAMSKSNIMGTNLGKKKFQNTLHLSSHIFGDRFSRAAAVGMCSLVEPLRAEHGVTQIMLSTVSGHREWYHTMALGARYDTVIGIVRQLCSRELGYAMHMDDLYESDKAEANKLTSMLFDFAIRNLFEEGIFLLSYHLGLPGRFLALCSKDDEGEQLAAGYIRAVWSGLCKAEELAMRHEGRAVKAWLKDMVWAHATWCREVCVGIDECDGRGPPDDLREELFWVSSGPLYTTPVEKAFNLLRRSTDHSLSRNIGNAAVWHRCVKSDMTTELGHREVVITAADAVEKAGKIQELMFKAKAHKDEFSLGPAPLDVWSTGTGWPSPSASNFFKQFMMNGALLDCEQQLADLDNVWLSMLAEGACALTLASEVLAGTNHQVYVVLGTCEYGVLTWESTVRHTETDFSYIVMNTIGGLENLRHICIKDFDTYMAIPYEPMCLPRVIDEGVPLEIVESLGTFVLVVRDSPVSLLCFAGIHAFQGLTSHYLSKLITKAQIAYKPPKPTRLDELLSLVMKHVFPHMEKSTLDDMIKRRTNKVTPTTVIDASVAEMVADVLDDAERSLVEKIAKKEQTTLADFQPRQLVAADAVADDGGQPSQAAGRLRQAKLQRAASTPVQPIAQPVAPPIVPQTCMPPLAPPFAQPVDPPPVPNVPSSLPSGLGLPRARAPQAPRIDTLMFTAAEARKWTPQWPGCYLSMQENCRWEIKYRGKPLPPYSRTATWGSGVSHVAALEECLRWAWGHHSNLDRGECPFDLCTWSVTGPAAAT
jgi:hypothetical protein